MKSNSNEELDLSNNIESQERLSLIMKRINDGIWDWNLLTDEVYYSLQWKNMLGYSDEEIENHLSSWAKLVHPDDKYKALNKVQECIDGHIDEFEIEMRMTHKNGNTIIVLSRGFIVRRDEDNKPIRFIGTHLNITDRKRAADFIKDTNSILEMIALGKSAYEVYDAIALMYEKRHPGMRCSLLELEDGKLLHGGAPSMPQEYCQAVHGLEIGPNIGSCGTSTYTGNRVLVENIETDLKWKYIKQYALPHGMRCCWSEPILSSKGEVLGAFGMYYNFPALPNDEELKDLISAGRLASIVMERDQAQKRIKKDQIFISEQSKLASMGEMLGNIAHQWRQPLSVITTIASSLKLEEEHGVLNTNNISANMSEIMKQSKYLSQTVDDFRLFIKDSKNKELTSLVDVVKSSLIILNASLKNSHVEVITNFHEDIEIMGYKNDLKQAFINILTNAKDAINDSSFNDEDKYIFICTKRDENRLVLEIKDTGLGINRNIINRVFEPYFTTKHQSVGTGIGLSMAHQIITTKHDGEITVKNVEFTYKDKEYKGACFSIYLA